ncbi:cell division protein PerM [Streptomyces sp. NPDC054863]
MNPNPVTEHEHEHEHEPERERDHEHEGERGSHQYGGGLPIASAAWGICLVRGVLAAGLGLGAFAVLVMVLWISSPYPDAGAGAALHVAAGLWLLAHGADLVRHDTLSGVAAPVGLTPMLCAVLPVWLAHRAARDALEDDGGEDGAAPRNVPSGWAAFGGVTIGYLAVGCAVTLYAAGGPLPAAPGTVAVWLPLVVAVAAAAGVWTAYGRPHGPLPGWVPEGVRREFVRPRLATAARATAAGATVLVGGGALVVGASLTWHADLAQESFLRLAVEWSGRFAVLLLALALVPNAAVWAASYGMGVGFGLGTGAVVTPLGGAGAAALPHFPLLAALPGQGRGTALNWAVSGVPLAAGLTVAWFTVRAAAPAYAVREEAWGRRRTAATAALAAVGCGAVMAVLAAVSGGPLGTERLAEFGPVWWKVGLGALVWVAGVGVLGALALRGWRLREWSWGSVWSLGSMGWLGPTGLLGSIGSLWPFGGGRREGVGVGGSAGGEQGVGEQGVGGGGGEVAGDSWHDSGVREVRWAGLREASGGLMAELPPVPSVAPTGAVSGASGLGVSGPGPGQGSVSLPLPGLPASAPPVPVVLPVVGVSPESGSGAEPESGSGSGSGSDPERETESEQGVGGGGVG